MERRQYITRVVIRYIEIASEAQGLIDKNPELEEEGDREAINKIMKEGKTFLILLESKPRYILDIENTLEGLNDLFMEVVFICERYKKNSEKKKYFEIFRKESGSNLNKAKQQKHGPEIAKRREIIKELYKPVDLTDSDKFAEAIKTELDLAFKRFGIKPASARTIRRDIQAILRANLTECGKS